MSTHKDKGRCSQFNRTVFEEKLLLLLIHLKGPLGPVQVTIRPFACHNALLQA